MSSYLGRDSITSLGNNRNIPSGSFMKDAGLIQSLTGMEVRIVVVFFMGGLWWSNICMLLGKGCQRCQKESSETMEVGGFFNFL